MATMLAAELALRSEVEARIVALTPDREPTTRFLPAENVDKKLGDFEGRYIGPRYFQLGMPRDGGQYSTGYSNDFDRVHYDILIQYPSGEYWTTAAHSDRSIITRDLRTNHGTTTGVQLRWFKDNYPWELLEDDDDPWQILRMELTVHYETGLT
jgi:hypothetical protein